ncbi:MAG: dipeptidase [Bradyrhizobiaceae bacterium]|nr:dipeptidase [Bradyrhizobiaceae bacterium]
MEHSINYAKTQSARFEAELSTLLSIPSVSTDEANTADVQHCADWLREHLLSIGMESVQVIPTPGHPLVYAEHRSPNPDAPTILFYGHYDVQPVDPIDLWTTPPFSSTVRDGKVYARGATDDKGQVFVHIKAIESMLRHSPLPINIKLLIEGEEEIGSPNLGPFVEQRAQQLQCHAVVVSDTAMFAPGQPSLVVGLRGLAYVQIDVVGPNRDLHSGAYGGPVVNPLNALCDIIASMKDRGTGKIVIEGFYDSVRETTTQEKAEFDALGYQDSRLLADVQTNALGGENDRSTLEKLWSRPTLDVNGIGGGYQAPGAKTVLPSKAMAKVSMRLVPDQKSADVVELLKRHVARVTPPGVTVTVTDLHGANPVLVSREGKAMNAAAQALQETFEVPCVYQREGGSIPVVEMFSRILGVPTVLMGFGLSTENLHSPNEHFDLGNFHKGIEAAIRFYHHVAE